jgi:hypothetical protein
MPCCLREEQSVYFPGLPRERRLRKLAAVWMIQNRVFVTNKCCTACLSTPCPRFAFGRTSEIDLPHRSACGKSDYASAKQYPLTLRQSEPALYAHAPECSPRKISCKPRVDVPWINVPDVYHSRAAHVNILGHLAPISSFMQMQKLVTLFGNPCDIYLEALTTNTKKRRKEKI